MVKKEMCSHPMLVPTQWNQPKPEPAEMVGCACGMNMSCPVCGYGRGASPCDCSLTNVIDEYRAGRTKPLGEFVAEVLREER